MAIKIGVCANKGGQSKTTTSIELADVLATEYNKKCLLINQDQQKNLETLLGVRTKISDGGLAGVLLDGFDPEKVLVKARPNIDLIPSGGKKIIEFDRQYSKEENSEHRLGNALQGIEDLYDYIIIDHSPAMSLMSVNSIMYCDYIITPTTPDLLSLVAVKEIINTIEHYQKRGHKTAQFLGCVLTQWDSRRRIDNMVLGELQNLEEHELLGGGTVFNPIKYATALKTSQVKRKMLSEAAPKSNVYEEYKGLIAEVLERIELDMSESIQPIYQMKQTHGAEAQL